MITKKFETFRDKVLAKEKEGKIIIATFEGFAKADLDEIIKQPVEGLLYDLNRDRATILTFIEDKKWVNDFACMKVIEKLKALCDEKPICNDYLDGPRRPDKMKKLILLGVGLFVAVKVYQKIISKRRIEQLITTLPVFLPKTYL